ncbi:adenylyltransferase/cytidyltransferase family protein [Kribbella sp. NBC_01245]|uniref:adenylyltransferase/cytidyltransferase family protein n=1 Tax=Kribbella sp. NBC_01245 TaxID=2903578 RepID=UPI002E29DA03|nr:adenylyltransferase/cytidyltransferase family protein [Kribbella sp. NBC_01245]
MTRYPVVYASGVFDMFHIGHLNILRRARRHCDHLVVGVATDDYVRQAKGRAPIVPFDDRREIVASIRGVDETVVDESEDKTIAWSRRHFDAIVKGDDWHGTPKGERLQLAMADLGVAVIYLPYTPHTSSSLLRARLTDSPERPMGLANPRRSGLGPHSGSIAS